MTKRFRNISLILFTLVVLLAQIVAPVAALAEEPTPTQSTYKLTQTGLAASYPTRKLVDVTGKSQTEINSAVEAAVSGLTPIKVTLATDVLGAAGYEAVRILPVKAGDHIQLWAKDTLNNWYDINKVGWGPPTGFPLPPQYNATTDVYLLADQAGTYTLTVQLVDVNNNNEVIATSSEQVMVSPVPGTFEATGKIGAQNGKVYEEYQLKVGDNVIDLSSSNVKSITVLEPNETKAKTLDPNTDTTLWFNVQKPSGDYKFTVVTKAYETYEATLNWTAPTPVNAVATGREGDHEGNHYVEYKLGNLDLSSFDKMYQIKPLTQDQTVPDVIELTANSDKNLWFKTTGQIPGTHTFLVKKDNTWYTATIKWAPPSPPTPPTPPTPPAQKPPTFDVGDVQKQIDAGKDKVEVSVPADAPEPAAVLTPAALEKLVQANKPLVLDIKGVTFTLEPGAIQAAQGASGVKLEAKPLADDEASRLVGNLPTSYKLAGKVLSLTAASVVGEATQPVTFQKPVTVTVSYDPASVTNPDFLGAYRYNPDTKKWDYLGGKADKDKKVVTFTTPHLSEYAIMEYHKTFNDVAGSFAKADIEYLASRYIIYGVTDTKFDPLGNITRAQFCALVARALNLQASSGSPSFKDVSGSYWAAKEIQAAAQAGIVKGYTDGTFRPDQLINREQLAAMVARALVYSHGGTLPAPEQAQIILNRFQDQNRITSGLAQEAALAADKGIVLGTADKRFDPFGTATREQAAAMLARMYRQLP